MEWFTTKQAAEALKITSSRVRQLISRYKNEAELIRVKNGKGKPYYLVSDLFIKKVGKAGKEYREQLFKVGEPKEQPDGTIIEAFTPEQYELFERQLTEYHQIKKDLTQIEQRFKDHIADLKEQIEDLKQQRNFLQKSLEVQQKETGNLLQVVQQRNLIEATEKKVG